MCIEVRGSCLVRRALVCINRMRGPPFNRNVGFLTKELGSLLHIGAPYVSLSLPFDALLCMGLWTFLTWGVAFSL